MKEQNKIFSILNSTVEKKGVPEFGQLIFNYKGGKMTHLEYRENTHITY